MPQTPGHQQLRASLYVIGESLLGCQVGWTECWLHYEEDRLPVGGVFRKWRVPLWDELGIGNSSERKGTISERMNLKCCNLSPGKTFPLVIKGLRMKYPLCRHSMGVECCTLVRMWAVFQCPHHTPRTKRFVQCTNHTTVQSGPAEPCLHSPNLFFYSISQTYVLFFLLWVPRPYPLYIVKKFRISTPLKLIWLIFFNFFSTLAHLMLHSHTVRDTAG